MRLDCHPPEEEEEKKTDTSFIRALSLFLSYLNTECFGGMVCYQRKGRRTSVPGCDGRVEPGKDYCIDPLDNPSNHHEDTFRLKLFWRFGYKWQEETKERAWCMQCDGSRCGEGDKMRISECDGGNTEFRFINRVGQEAQIYIPDRDLCLESPPGKVQMKVEECDNSKPSQRFWAGPEGDFSGDRFELHPMSDNGMCVTQRHHPKASEVLYSELCDEARKDKTSLWNMY